ncbi:MAG TPA: SCO family protein, partial [Candidatus Tumulicola sp.]|nr:SCO family protein [Candidatus Tumulicola sp.]
MTRRSANAGLTKAIFSRREDPLRMDGKSPEGAPGSRPRTAPRRWLGQVRARVWLLALALLLAAVSAGAALALVSRPASDRTANTVSAFGPAATWPPGVKAAPDFSLRAQDGRRISLAALRGRTVLLTFIDPACRNLCPLEARELNGAVQSSPTAQRPAIVSVNVNPWAETAAMLRADREKWALGSDWRWALGSLRELRPVWRSYRIAVADRTRTLAHVVVHDVSHTEATYVIDRSGHVRALFLWPFSGDAVMRTA